MMNFLENLLVVAMHSKLSIIAKLDTLSTPIEGYDVFERTEAATRQAAFDSAYQQALSAANFPPLKNLLSDLTLQEEIVNGLLDPMRGLDLTSVLPLLEKEVYSVIAVRRFFNTLQGVLLGDPCWGTIFDYYQKLHFQAGRQSAMANLRIDDRSIVHKAGIVLSGSGAIAAGASAKAVGEDGLLVEGNYTQNIINIIIDEVVIRDLPNVSHKLNGRNAYLQHLIRTASLLPWANLSLNEQQNNENENMELVDIYIGLDTTYIENRSSEDKIRQELLFAENLDRIDILELVKKERKILLLGDPGSGKSTAIQYLVSLLAQASIRSKGKAELKQDLGFGTETPLPIWVNSRRLAAFLENRGLAPDSMALFEYFDHELNNLFLGEFSQEFSTEYVNGDHTLFIFIDGLDEVTSGQREKIVSLVNQISSLYPAHRFLIASRIYACIGQSWKLNSFSWVTLAPFSQDKIRQFIEKWLRWKDKRRQSTDAGYEFRAVQIKRMICRSELEKIASRPLLLTMMIQLYSGWGFLAEDRTQLYGSFVQLLLNTWENQGNYKGSLLDFLGSVGMKMSDLELGLCAVAFQAHQQQEDPHVTAKIDEADLRKWLAPFMGNDWNKAGLFIEFIHDRVGLLLSHKSGVYTFPHLSFQEYLAASYLITLPDYPTESASLVKESPVRWHEVFIFSAGRAARTHRIGVAMAAINELVPWKGFEGGSVEPSDYAPVTIAAKSVLEMGLNAACSSSSGRATVERIRAWLTSAITEGSKLAADERVEAGRLLGKIGDLRNQVLTVEHMEFVAVPVGSFWLGSDPNIDPDAQQREQPRHELHLDDFLISRYLVTNAQFNEFVSSDCYQQEKYWPEAKQAGMWGAGLVKGYGNDSPKSSPMDYGEPFNLPNHPVTGVNWYEAMAFAHWLTEKWQQQGVLADDWEVVLPSEAEWEKAARGGLQLPLKLQIFTPSTGFPRSIEFGVTEPNPFPNRIYPWGDMGAPEFANYDDTHIFTTSAVGCFPRGRSPYGILDMGGNIWQFTRSIYYDYPYPQEKHERQPRECLEMPDEVVRVARGGSFNHPLRGSRCSDRGRGRPGRYDRHGGFLLVIIQKDEEVSEKG